MCFIYVFIIIAIIECLFFFSYFLLLLFFLNRKRTCAVNLGGHCSTEHAAAVAQQWHYLNSAMSPGRKRRDTRMFKKLIDGSVRFSNIFTLSLSLQSLSFLTLLNLSFFLLYYFIATSHIFKPRPSHSIFSLFTFSVN